MSTHEPAHGGAGPDDESRPEHIQGLFRAAVCGAGTAVGFAVERFHGELTVTALAAYLVAYAAGSFDAVRDTWSLLRKRQVDVHLLMLAVAAGAACIGHWWEGAVLMFLFSLSGALEDFAEFRTRREIQSLFKDSPRSAARLLDSGEEESVPVESLAPGMTIRIRPGEQVPVDALVLTGESAADESALTGESAPVDKQPGDRVMAGTLNVWGKLDCRVERPAAESALAQIIRLIRHAQASKAPAQRFTDRFGSGYTLFILLFCAGMFGIWKWGLGKETADAFYRTMTLLVVASPCALVLSIPSAILAGIAAGARRGILFRGGVAIEKLAEANRIAMDKTGTLTTGHLSVESVESRPPGRETDVLRVAAALSEHSTHPVSRAITRRARRDGLALPTVESFRSVNGLGLSGSLRESDPAPCRLGRRSFFDGADWTRQFPPPPLGVTETLVESRSAVGRLLLRDEIRHASRPLIERLKSAGLRVSMLSGDRPEAAGEVARALGVDDVRAGLDPEGKVRLIREWTAAGDRVVMIGDGVNDAPSLAAAHVGVAMGLRGSDAALEQADVVLMQDRLDRFCVARQLSLRAARIIRQNLAISLGSVIVLVAAAFAGVIPLTVGVIGHEGSTVIVVLNSLRLILQRSEE